MRDSLFWRLVAISVIVTGHYIGHGLHVSLDASLPDPFFATPAYAGGVSALTDDTEYFVTTSEDGRTVYVWEFNGARSPQFQAQAVAKK